MDENGRGLFRMYRNVRDIKVTGNKIREKSNRPEVIKINKTQILLKYFLVYEVLNFLKNDGKMFKYYKRLDDV
jgi:hypothetical protein